VLAASFAAGAALVLARLSNVQVVEHKRLRGMAEEE